MKVMHQFTLFILFILISQNTWAQKVTVSKEINIRNNYKYDILPNIGEHIIFYHDEGATQSFEIFDKDLRHKADRNIELEKRNINPIGIITTDTSFNYYYSYKDDGKIFVRVNQYDRNVYLTDSATILIKDRRQFEGNSRFTFSEDKSKVLIFTPDDKSLNVHLVDNRSISTLYNFVITLKDFNFKTDFEKIILTNSGDIYILGRKSGFWSTKNENIYTLIKVNRDETITLHNFNTETDRITDMKIDFDEKNSKLVMAGFTTLGDENSINGYFGFSIDPRTLPQDAEILTNKFSLEFMADASGKKVGKVKELSFFKFQDLIVRNDGGVIIIAELSKEFVRRSQINSPYQFGNNYATRGFIDYYHEDLIVLSTFADGKEHWNKVLFKKQFSQDDDGAYSSYFLFKTPSRLKLVYNDEIKSSNTVSEYVLDPMGNTERKSVLSTEYQNLRLRFRDAIQIGPSSFIVPSEKSWKINLVKIDYP